MCAGCSVGRKASEGNSLLVVLSGAGASAIWEGNDGIQCAAQDRPSRLLRDLLGPSVLRGEFCKVECTGNVNSTGLEVAGQGSRKNKRNDDICPMG